MPFPFRAPTALDIPALNRLIWAAKSSWGYDPHWLETKRAELEVYPQALHDGRGLVALNGPAIVAFCLVLPDDPDWRLEHLWVQPDHQRGGLGSLLLTHALNATAEAGYPGLLVDSEPLAEAFYLRHGAVRRGVVPAPIPGAPDRIRPQLWLPVARPNTALVPPT